MYFSILDEMTNLMNSSLRGGGEPPSLVKNDVSCVHVQCVYIMYYMWTICVAM